jgi:hypothetical protein
MLCSCRGADKAAAKAAGVVDRRAIASMEFQRLAELGPPAGQM